MSTPFGTMFVPVVAGDDCPQCTWHVFIDVTSAVHAAQTATVDLDATGKTLTVKTGAGALRTFVQPRRGPTTITEFVRMTGLPVTAGRSHRARVTSATEGGNIVHTVEVLK